MADFQNVSCFVFEQSIMFHKASAQNIYNVYYFKTSSIWIFDAIEKQSGIGFIKGPPNTIFLANALKKTTENFPKFLFVFESTILSVNNGK